MLTSGRVAPEQTVPPPLIVAVGLGLTVTTAVPEKEVPEQQGKIMETFLNIGKAPALIIGGVVALGGVAAAVLWKERKEKKGLGRFIPDRLKRK